MKRKQLLRLRWKSRCLSDLAATSTFVPRRQVVQAMMKLEVVLIFEVTERIARRARPLGVDVSCDLVGLPSKVEAVDGTLKVLRKILIQERQ